MKFKFVDFTSTDGYGLFSFVIIKQYCLEMLTARAYLESQIADIAGFLFGLVLRVVQVVWIKSARCH